MNQTAEVDLAVFGAHLRGQPLNGQLTALSASFARAVRTAAVYRLHVLPGSMPRPGLVRVREEGGAIAGEIWRLPVAGFGRFVADIVAPLCIGTVALDDGSTVKGFLCESWAVAGCPDITAHGGWAAWMAAR